MGIFYRPPEGAAGDFIPFYWNGEYHLFYLKDYRDEVRYGPGTPWFHLVTRDFVHFQDWGEALPRGPAGSQDTSVFTGCVIERDGVFHIFYTGHNPDFADTDKPQQAIMRATSPDLRIWTKDPSFQLFAPQGYEKNDWRDPFVFWNAEPGEYWMLLAARHPEGPTRHRGCIALAASPDLSTWEVRTPFWTPDEYYTHECPDLFQIGDWWYLVYSTFSERFVTHYRMSRSLQGPWLAPPTDTFDGRAYYAAKTAGDDHRRFVFGWLPTRTVEKDDGSWQWGGNLVVHEIVQQPDGPLTVRIPHTVVAAFSQSVKLFPKPALGAWTVEGDSFAASAVGRFSALMLGTMPEECLVEARVDLAEGTAAAGLLLRADDNLDAYYQVRLELPNQRIVIDRWPRPGDQPFIVERPLSMSAGQPVVLRVIADGTCLVVYANDQVAACCRMYDHRAGALGLFVTEGEANFGELSVKIRPENAHEAT